jgi:tRNA G10  N-methylase Trm11
MKVFYVPGRKWHLSLAEIRSVFSAENVVNIELIKSPSLFVFDVRSDEETLSDIFSRLGGFIKYGQVIEDPFEYLESEFIENVSPPDGKVNFSISFYGESVKKSSRERTKLGITVKKWLQEHGFRARFVSKHEEMETSTVLIDKNKVLTKGFELVRFENPKREGFIWGVTGSMQDYEGFSQRDYDRPRVNKEKGMIPPKLARMMVNFSQTPKEKVIWDPFCGSGTILMEALMLGYTVIGTDIDPEAVEETRENLAWLCDNKWISHTKYTVFEHDITKGLPDSITFGSIVTEPYLGPVLKEEITVAEIDSISKDIYPLFDAVLDISGKIEGNGRIVVVVPGFKSPHGWLDMDPLEQNGSAQVEDITGTLSEYPLQWDRPNSIIRRNIKILSF